MLVFVNLGFGEDELLWLIRVMCNQHALSNPMCLMLADGLWMGCILLNAHRKRCGQLCISHMSFPPRIL
jgi:hypothetical protein